MTVVKRRARTKPLEEEPAQKKTHEGGRPLDYGVEPGASVAVCAALLKFDRDTDQPFCTCTSRKAGFGFDPQIGIYLHVGCWKPSKAMYTAALQAGVLEKLIERGAISASEGSGQGRDRTAVHVPSGNRGNRPQARRRSQ